MRKSGLLLNVYKSSLYCQCLVLQFSCRTGTGSGKGADENNTAVETCGEHIFVWAASPSLTQLYKKPNLSRTSILKGGIASSGYGLRPARFTYFCELWFNESWNWIEIWLNELRFRFKIAPKLGFWIDSRFTESWIVPALVWPHGLAHPEEEVSIWRGFEIIRQILCSGGDIAPTVLQLFLFCGPTPQPPPPLLYSQLAIWRTHTCLSSGYSLRSMGHASVKDILEWNAIMSIW